MRDLYMVITVPVGSASIVYSVTLFQKQSQKSSQIIVYCYRYVSRRICVKMPGKHSGIS